MTNGNERCVSHLASQATRICFSAQRPNVWHEAANHLGLPRIWCRSLASEGKGERHIRKIQGDACEQ